MKPPDYTGLLRLDFNKPPEGWTVEPAGEGFRWSRHTETSGILPTRELAVAQTWALHELEADPPGYLVAKVLTQPGDEERFVIHGLPTAAGPSSAVPLQFSVQIGYATGLDARRTAWRCFRRRIKIADRIAWSFTSHPTHSSTAREFWRFRAVLHFTGSNCRELERWFVDSTAELPSVLVGWGPRGYRPHHAVPASPRVDGDRRVGEVHDTVGRLEVSDQTS